MYNFKIEFETSSSKSNRYSHFNAFVETLQLLYETFFSQMSCFRDISPVRNFLSPCIIGWSKNSESDGMKML